MGRQQVPKILLCLVAADTSEDSGTGSNTDDPHYNPLFDYDYPDLPPPGSDKTPTRPISPLPDHSAPWAEEEEDVFIKQEPNESDLDDLDDTEDIFEENTGDDGDQQEDTPLSGFIPASHIGHKRTISAVSAMDEDAPAPHEEEGMDPLLKELVKSKSPENTIKSQEQLEEEANMLEAQKKEWLGSLHVSSLRNTQQKEVQNGQPEKKQVWLQEVPTDGPSSQTWFRKQWW